MDAAHARRAAAGPAARGDAHLQDADPASASSCYCPRTLLASFALLMAGHGRCVKTDMMLGDREYAMWQLACARELDDRELAEVTTRLLAYFDDPQHTGVPVLGTA